MQRSTTKLFDFMESISVYGINCNSENVYFLHYQKVNPYNRSTCLSLTYTECLCYPDSLYLCF